jgi:S1-C subfamily serine protease
VGIYNFEIMVKIIYTFILIFCFNFLHSQDNQNSNFSTIYFVRTNGIIYSASKSYIKLPYQNIFELANGAVVEYQIYSEGEINIGVDYQGALSLFYLLNVEHGNEYYVFLNGPSFNSVPKQRVISYLNKPKSYTKKEEDNDNPINRDKSGKGQGTCFLISAEGYFITNYHCIENAKEITVKGIDGDFTTKFGATVVASDPSNDLALLKISNKNVKFENPPFAIRSVGVAQAEKVYALGYPKADAMGKEVKITEGIISAKSGVRGDISKFQISAAVNSGNSGGPLIDEDGNLIGVIFAKSTIADAAGYAIKSSYLETFLNNVDGFTIPNLTNLYKDKSLPQKVEILSGFIFIIETN